MPKRVYGKNTIENLTTAMYSDSKIIFREYVQNSCDSIRDGIKNGIITQEEAKIHINISKEARSISIIDNGVGIPRVNFERVLSDIANSDKVRGEGMGFRGIGRLCGLAYCTQMQFISTAYGETDICIMNWDAGTMKSMLDDNKKYTSDDVLDTIMCHAQI
ncbi:MAG: ATP-binding protein [Oscillospiraceae bacterium]|jgi:molecular chaperone HtpG|nr:ATP-binding protein [Oscillospiraceae bacterium]